MSCNGNCGSCGSCVSCGGGCARQLVITEAELDFLLDLGQFAFLPVARAMGDLTPVYLESGEQDVNSLMLQCLEKKGLISLDYDKPLQGFDYAAYGAYPVRGSMALTEKGQKVLETLHFNGIDWET